MRNIAAIPVPPKLMKMRELFRRLKSLSRPGGSRVSPPGFLWSGPQLKQPISASAKVGALGEKAGWKKGRRILPKPSLCARNVDKLTKASEGVRYYFWMLKELLENVSSPEPALAYCFQNIESAQRMALYALLMRRYRTDSELTWKAIDDLDITRSNFPDFYQAFSGKTFPVALRDKMHPAERIRDAITHGRMASTSQIHGAIAICLDYAEELNDRMWADVGFRPFGKLQGVTSSRRPQLGKDISHLVLKGLGLYRAKARQQALASEAAQA